MNSLRIIFLFAIVIFTACSTAPQKQNDKLLFPIIYVDMDGTALDSNKELRPKTIEAFQEFLAAGGKLGIATGRAYEQVQKYILQIKPNLPLVLSDGALTTTAEGKPLLASRLPEDILSELVSLTPKMDGLTGIYFYYSQGIDCDRDNEKTRDLAKIGSMKLDQICGDIKKCIDEARANPDKGLPLKIIYLIDVDKFESAFKTVELTFKNRVKISTTKNTRAIIEISPAGTNKIATIKAVVEKEGYTVKDVVYFGDSKNDLEALSTVPLGIAMANCQPDACQAATFVTENNDSDAIGEIIERLILKK